MDDTIVAISTALGVGAISIIRLSGKDSIKIVNQIFKGKNLETAASHTINYGHIIDNNEEIDEVLVSIMKSPKTYTKENIVEINCHGGINTTKTILETVLNHGARLAEPGEFTKRAFLNGRIDLSQCEAVMDLISSKNSDDRLIALKSLEGSITKKIRKFREELNDLIAHIEVNIDFPEYQDIEIMTKEKISDKLNNQIKELKNIIEHSEEREILKVGIKTLIIGRPNVGKSSILNNLLQYDKAIVTDIEGTTRDIVEGEINLNGITLNIIDTAGIRQTNDIIEKIGVEKSLNLISQADLILVVLNNNEKLTNEDKTILQKTKNKARIVVINKIDLEGKIEIDLLNKNEIIKTNAKDLYGLDKLKERILEMFNSEQISKPDFTYLSNSRQISLAKQAMSSMKQALKSLNNDLPVDMIQIDLIESFNKLGEILGITYSEEVIDNLFKNFCVGK